jgi:hypothetical protein
MLLLQTLVTAMDDIFYGISPTRIMYSLTAFLESIGDFYKSPRPGPVFDIYMKYWGSIHFTI